MTSGPVVTAFHADITQCDGDPLGEGYFGKVYKAEDRVHGTVAIKVLQRLSGETDAQWTSRRHGLVKEGQTLSSARDDRIVRVIHVFDDANQMPVVLVMEYCPGGSLEAEYKRGPLCLSAARDATTDACLGLQILHLRGMLHRDIRPANLLRGADGRVKVGDFGLVTDDIVLGYASANAHTDYMAYELWSIGGLCSVRTDIWAMGMTAYNLLHGKDWLILNTGSKPRNQVAKGGFAKRLPWLPHIPRKWRELLRKAMHDDPRKRFQTVADLRRGLADCPVVDWSCAIAPASTTVSGGVTWTKYVKDRCHRVEWQWTTNDSHSWQAISYPTGHGIKRKLGGSAGVREKVIGELEAFFETH